jgi:hypothetical protein
VEQGGREAWNRARAWVRGGGGRGTPMLPVLREGRPKGRRQVVHGAVRDAAVKDQGGHVRVVQPASKLGLQLGREGEGRCIVRWSEAVE